MTETIAAAPSGVYPHPLISRRTIRKSAAVSAADSRASARLAAMCARPTGVWTGWTGVRGTSTSAASAIGTCARKMACQLMVSVSAPPMAGPAAAPSAPAPAQTAVARRSDPSSRGSSSSAAQTAAAPPSACTPRATRSMVKLSARPQASDAAANTAMPTMQTICGAWRRARYAAGTAARASTRLNSVSTQVTSSMETSKRSRMSGSARMTTDESASTTPTTAARPAAWARWLIDRRVPRSVAGGLPLVREGGAPPQPAAGPPAEIPEDRDERRSEKRADHERLEHDADHHRQGELAEDADRHQRQQGEAGRQGQAGASDRARGSRRRNGDRLVERPKSRLLPDPAGQEDVVVGAQRHEQHACGKRHQVRQLTVAEQLADHDP